MVDVKLLRNFSRVICPNTPLEWLATPGIHGKVISAREVQLELGLWDGEVVYMDLDHFAKFKSYALETVEELVKNYPWYYLPASVHKIILYGSEVIDRVLLSIGELLEEAAEFLNNYSDASRQEK
ncbi:unnamed protein product [Psylliodes chrysocephalus]|uniref:Uncharacterized protein n=1 Tax=Psylliodes chrysocephalus TaxID=3402493 RepID=A0A9P0GI56_9CUCU|nr:unnamed protein product [Psylliodes chrysocephala]